MSAPDKRIGQAGVAEGWDDAPCGLLRLDADGLVLAANTTLLDLLGYERSAVVGRLRFVDLLTTASRMFFEAQLAPMLLLEGRLQEVMLDLSTVARQRVPVLVNAIRVTATGTAEAGKAAVIRLALMSVPDRRAYENELRAAREQAEQARAAENRGRLRLEFLARANAALVGTSEVDVLLDDLARVLVPEMADWCLIYAADAETAASGPPLSAVHADPRRQPQLARLAGLLPEALRPSPAARVALDRGQPVLYVRLTDGQLLQSTDSAEVRRLYDVLGASSAIVIPSRARGVRAATIIVVRGADRDPFHTDDLHDLADLGARAGIAIDNAQQHAREHGNSIALQQALLTSPPTGPDLDIVTRYLPATAGNAVGGDWYDAFRQSDGTLMLVIGDVVGHDIHAAAAMGQLRGVIRAVGYIAGRTPAAILSQADQTARGLGVTTLATAVVAQIEPRPGGALLRWSNAGHPPPLIVGAEGGARTLASTPEPILGFDPDLKRHDQEVALAPDDVLVLYTDGLVETVDDDLEVGIARLANQLCTPGTASQVSLDELSDRALTEHREGRRDDIALLLYRAAIPPNPAVLTTGRPERAHPSASRGS
ncbi:MAG TPA: SpoIIE family protein phosphatase [Jatrophihabitans sp.]|nr:SpoIIE family protein phosphatase [Jatrophihabitans sp.]